MANYVHFTALLKPLSLKGFSIGILKINRYVHFVDLENQDLLGLAGSAQGLKIRGGARSNVVGIMYPPG